VRRAAPLLVVPLLVTLVVSLAAAAAPQEPAARATAQIVRVAQPGLPDEIGLSIAAPPSAEQVSPAFSYPADGSVVKVGSADAQVVAQAGTSSSAQANAGALAISLFAGEITLESFDLRASVAAGAVSASGNVAASTMTGLTVLGQLVTPSPNLVVPLADWGSLEVLGSQVQTVQEEPRSSQATLTALRVKLISPHGGLAAGSVIELGSVTATAAVAPAPIVPATPTAPTRRPTKPKHPVIPADAPKEPGASIPGAPAELVRPAPAVTAQLTNGGYVFPVFGPASYGDTFGAPRADVAGGWHHGEDIFGPLGTPLLAVADGTMFSVGWNDIGGWRMWLRDRAGNEFYYAHLSAYSPLAVNGRQVKAGDVIGFMGKTGDAEFSPVHLHFEIHPVSLLAMGYDGAVAPYPFLTAWRRAQDVSFDAGRAYLPLDGPTAARRGVAPPAGVVMLEADDISSTSGLVPGAIESALTGRAPKSPTGGQDR
jgi:murein DD-endopeptidase MepM/ murein hydrolase activator NlpD